MNKKIAFLLALMVLLFGCQQPPTTNAVGDEPDAVKNGEADQSLNREGQTPESIGEAPLPDDAIVQDDNLAEGELPLDDGLPDYVPRNSPSVRLTLNTITIYLKAGDTVNVSGTGSYSGKKLTVTLDEVLNPGAGSSSFNARFRVLDEENSEIATTLIGNETELEFFDANGMQVTFDAFLFVESISVPA